MRFALKAIDSASHWVGLSARWLALALVLVGAYDAIMRYVFSAATIWAYETSIMMGAVLYALAFAYDHSHNFHIRIDIFYLRLSPRGRAILDVVCFAIFFLPLMTLLSKNAVEWAYRGWAISEVMVESYWYPPASPVRTAVALGICLFTLQGLAIFIRDLYLVIRGKPLD